MIYKKKIAIVGTVGLPSLYGGFETLADYLVRYLSSNYDITVWCSWDIPREKRQRQYHGARLKYLPFSANGMVSIIYDILSLLFSINMQKIIVLGVSGGLIFPFLRPVRGKLIINIGGLDWKRSKWTPLERKILKWLEGLAIRNSGIVVADNAAIKSYLENEYGIDAVLIEYGGDHVFHVKPDRKDLSKYPFLTSRYAFSVARIQPDNNVELILEAFSKCTILPIVFVGNWGKSKYGKSLQNKFAKSKNIIILNEIYEARELNLLRSNCTIYIHGHSAGGTNPSLVEAMYLALPIVAYDSVFNRVTTENKALYFKDIHELKSIISLINSQNLLEKGNQMKEIAERRYKWSYIAEEYDKLIRK